jgi:Spy/CpxP family protein refolding chaperone
LETVSSGWLLTALPMVTCIDYSPGARSGTTKFICISPANAGVIPVNCTASLEPPTETAVARLSRDSGGAAVPVAMGLSSDPEGLLMLSSLLSAQQPASRDPSADLMFPPELVMSRQNAIGLSGAQKTYLRNEVLKAQTRFTELQWSLHEAMEGLVGLLKQPKAHEAQVAAQLDKVLASEREIKRAQISLLVRIKNNLTAEQQHRLQTLCSKSK